jgi:hypothetical protein
VTSPWFDPECPPDVRTLTRNELRTLWAANRNSLLGTVAAEEYIRRDWLQQTETKKEAT